MALSAYVSLTITQTTANIARAGFGTGLLVSYTVSWAERTRTYWASDFKTSLFCSMTLATPAMVSSSSLSKRGVAG